MKGFCEHIELQTGWQQTMQFFHGTDWPVSSFCWAWLYTVWASECAGLSFRLNANHRTPPKLWISLECFRTQTTRQKTYNPQLSGEKINCLEKWLRRCKTSCVGFFLKFQQWHHPHILTHILHASTLHPFNFCFNLTFTNTFLLKFRSYSHVWRLCTF